MKRRSIFVSVTAFCLWLMAGSVAMAKDTDKERSQKHFTAGVSLLATDNYKVAAQEFESSVRLYPTKNGYFNLAICYFELRRYNDASAIIERLKKEFKDELDDTWKSEIEALEKKLSGVIVPVEFRANIDGAKIKLDGQEVGDTSHGSPFYLDPGDHVVTLSAEGFESITETITIQPGQGRTVFNFVMVSLAEKKEEGAGEGEEEEIQQNTTHPVYFKGEGSDKPKKKRKIGTIIAFSIAGATGAAAVTTGVIHLVGVGKIRDDCDGDLCDRGWEESLDKMLKLGVATNVLIAISAVGFVTGTILAFVEGRGDKKGERVSVDPAIWAEGGGLFVSRRF